MKRLFFLLFFGFLVCAKPPRYPHTFKAEIKQSLDPERVAVISRGVWRNDEGARVEAKMNAVWRIIQDLAQTPDEKSKIEVNKEKIFAEYEKFIERADLKGRQRTPEGDVEVEMEVIVSKKRLEDYLVNMGYIQKREEIIEVLENPTIVVIPQDKGAPWAEFTANEINSYLTTKKFEVLNPDTLDKLFEMAKQVEKIEGLPDDPLAKIALSIGADIYITFEGKTEEGQVGSDRTVKGVISLKAFETTTARLIGSSTGFSKELVAGPGKDRVTISEATRDAIDKALTQVMDYWKSDIKKGKQFLIFLYGNFEDIGTQKKVLDSVKAVSVDLKREVSTKNFVSFRIWFKGKSDEIVFALYDEFKKQGLKINPVVQNRKFIQANVE